MARWCVNNQKSKDECRRPPVKAVPGVITVLAKNACDGGGYRRLVFIKRREGSAVAVAGQSAALQENQERDRQELREAIEFMSATQSRQVATVERKQKLRSGAPEEIPRKVLQDVLVKEDRISAVETELLETGEQMRELTVEKRKTKAEGWRAPDTAPVGLDGKAVCGAQKH